MTNTEQAKAPARLARQLTGECRLVEIEQAAAIMRQDLETLVDPQNVVELIVRVVDDPTQTNLADGAATATNE